MGRKILFMPQKRREPSQSRSRTSLTERLGFFLLFLSIFFIKQAFNREMTTRHHHVPFLSLSLLATVILFQALIETTRADKLDVAIARGIMRPTSQVCTNYRATGSASTSFTDVFSSSDHISDWDTTNKKYEQDVFETEMSHSDLTNNNRTWTLRIGKGGHVMSFIGPYGEAIANQARTVSVWNDLVQQMVATRPGGANGFIHQSGPYMRSLPGMPPPFYSPKVAFECSDNQCTTVNWGQPSLGVHDNIAVSSSHASNLIFYTRYSNCGDGIIEVDQFFHNFGSDAKSYLNTPWTGVRTSTLKSMMVADTSGALQEEWPLGNWGQPPQLIRRLRQTGGFTTFAQHVSSTQSPLIKHPGFCLDSSTNKPQYCAVSNVEEYKFEVQKNGTATNSPAGHTTPPGASYTRRKISINGLAAGNGWDPVRNSGSHPPDGLLMRNTRTGYELPIVSVEHFSYHADKHAYISIDNSYSNSFINSKFRAGDGVEFYYAPARGKPVEDNLALTFVHGKAPEYSNSRMRVGIAGNKRRDGTVWTTNFQNAVSPSNTYFNRKFLITGEYTDMESQAQPLVDDTQEDINGMSDFANVGEVIRLYYDNEGFGATVGNETCRDKTFSCTGSSAPKSGMKPLFYITCADQNVVSHDPYNLNQYGASLRPWVCDSTSVTTRPNFKMLGYFPDGGCTEVSTLSYSENLCVAIPTTSPQTAPPTFSPTFPPSISPTYSQSLPSVDFPTPFPSSDFSGDIPTDVKNVQVVLLFEGSIQSKDAFLEFVSNKLRQDCSYIDGCVDYTGKTIILRDAVASQSLSNTTWYSNDKTNLATIKGEIIYHIQNTVAAVDDFTATVSGASWPEVPGSVGDEINITDSSVTVSLEVLRATLHDPGSGVTLHYIPPICSFPSSQNSSPCYNRYYHKQEGQDGVGKTQNIRYWKDGNWSSVLFHLGCCCRSQCSDISESDVSSVRGVRVLGIN